VAESGRTPLKPFPGQLKKKQADLCNKCSLMQHALDYFKEIQKEIREIRVAIN
jgi:hypothetical protein